MLSRKKTSIIIFLSLVAISSEFYKRELLAKTYFINEVTGKIVINKDDHGKAWYVLPADKKRYYLGKQDDALKIAKGLALPLDPRQLPGLGPIATYNQELDSDQDGLSDNLETWLATDGHKADSDNDGYNDKLELDNNYNPLGAGKLTTNKNLQKKYQGNFLFNTQMPGLFYLNPANKKLYYLENSAALLKLVQTTGVYLANFELNNIEGLTVGPEFMNEQIKKESTVQAPTPDTLTYSNTKDGYSFDFPTSWTIKKYPDSPDLIHITNAERDFIAEDKASIMLQIVDFQTTPASLTNFKTIAKDGAKLINEKTSKIVGKEAYTDTVQYKLMRKRRAIIAIGNNKFLSITLDTNHENNSYDIIYEKLLYSLKLK